MHKHFFGHRQNFHFRGFLTFHERLGPFLLQEGSFGTSFNREIMGTNKRTEIFCNGPIREPSSLKSSIILHISLTANTRMDFFTQQMSAKKKSFVKLHHAEKISKIFRGQKQLKLQLKCTKLWSNFTSVYFPCFVF